MASKKQESESDQYSWIVPQEFCWIAEQNLNDQNSEVFVPAQIVGFNKVTKMVTCQLTSGGDPKEIQADRLLIRNEQNETFDDMVNMDLLNEAELLQNLRKRYDDNKIYTYVGPTLLAVNPFKSIDNLYDNSTLIKYFSIIENFAEKNLHKKIPPHVYGLTAESFKDLFLNEKNQALVISGESGAGKTENTKYCMKFLTSLGQLEQTSQERITGVKDLEVRRRKSSYTAKIHNRPSIEDKILSCNPILEAFGNAKTVRNDNSSRFGKYVTIIVNKHDKMIVGAQIINYLLEKARITNQGQGERSFHIFYHFLKGADQEMLEKYGLEYPVSFEKYAYLAESKCFSVNKIDDVKLFQEVNQSFQILGFQNVQDSIYSFISAILLIGNLQFNDKTLTNDQPCSIISQGTLQQIAKLLQINEKKLTEGLTFKLRVIQKQNFMSPLQKAECNNTKDSLAKYLYERMFNLIVQKLNEIIIPDEQYDSSKTSNIGLLDIYGFEVFKENGFEQFFINYTNEKLQQLYIQYVFKQEEQVFVKEGLENYLQYLSFTDNKPVIDLLDMPPSGIFNILDDTCQTKGNDEKFLNKIRQTHKNNKYFQIPRITAKPTFIIVHSAKEVEYTATVFTEKNQDEIQELILNTLQESSNPLLSQLAQQEIEANKTKKKEKSLGSKFRSEMQYLMNDLMSCDCHFIRCIKANEEKKANCFKPVNALQQVRYLGVLESIKVRKQSYPIRKTYQLFYKRYALVNQDFRPYTQLCKENADFIKLSRGLFKCVFKGIDGNGNILFGKTRIFMQNRALNDIEKVYETNLEQLNQTSKRFQQAFYRQNILGKIDKKIQYFQLQAIKKIEEIITTYKNVPITNKSEDSIQIVQRQEKESLENIKLVQDSLAKRINQEIQIISFSDLKLYESSNSKKAQYQFKETLDPLSIESEKEIQNIVEIKYKMKYLRSLGTLLETEPVFKFKKQQEEMIERVKMVGRMIREKKAATKIQTNFKMYINRKKFLAYKKAAMKIQAFIKMKILSAYYNQLKISTNKIQKAVRKFLIKKHIRLERLQAYVNQCNFKDILCGEQQFSLGQVEENNFQADVNEMYYIQKRIQSKRKKNSKQPQENQKLLILPQYIQAKKNSVKPEFSSLKSREQIFKLMSTNKSQQSQLQATPGQESRLSSKQFLPEFKKSKPSLSSKALTQEVDFQEHSLEIVNSNSSIDLQDILERHQALKPYSSHPLKIEDQKALTNESNVSKRTLLRLKQEEPTHNDTKKNILSQMELSAINSPSHQIVGNNNQQKEHKIQEMYYYTSALDKIHNKNSPKKVQGVQSILSKGIYNTPQNKSASVNENTSNQNKQNVLTSLIDPSYKLTLQPQKIYMISHLIDFEIMSDTQDIYPPNGWSKYYQQQFQNSYSKKDYLQAICIGETHTLAISNSSQMYTWGWNDFGQLGTQEEINENEQKITKVTAKDLQSVEQVSIGNDFTLVLSKEGKLFGWGKNNKGQLGFYDEEGLISSVDVPIELISIKEDQIKSIKCRMNSVYIVLSNGSVYTNQKYSPYQKINFTQKVERVSCGFNFTMLLTNSQQIYSFGKNQHGQLGLNDKVDRKEPTLIPLFKTSQISQVECGFAHVVCQTNYGRVYVWGWGQNGQLGLGEYADQLEPQLCKLNNLYKDNVIQVCATRTSTLLLLNTSEILWFGTNQSIKYVDTPTIFKISQKFKQLEGMFCMKLSSSWSKTLGIVYGTFAFSKDINENSLQSTCNILTKKWVKNNIDQIKPPIVQSIYHKFPQQYMDQNESPKKPKETSATASKTQSPQVIKIEDYSSISNIQEASIQQFDVEQSMKDFALNQEEQQKKLKEIKHKIEFLKTLPLKQLRQIDKQLLELYKQKQYDKILENKKFFN